MNPHPHAPSGKQLLAVAIACVAAALVLRAARSHSGKPMSSEHTSSTRAIERAGGPCKACGSEKYLDAADSKGVNALRCPQCDFGLGKVVIMDQTMENLDLDSVLRTAGTKVPDAAANCHVSFLKGTFQVDATTLFAQLEKEIDWQCHKDALADETVVEQPRCIAYQATNASFVYTYPGITKPLVPSGQFSAAVDLIRLKVQQLLGNRVKFNSAHLNLYRDGGDHLSWHTDEDVALYGDEPCIASVSFGATRNFVMRRMVGKPYQWQPLDASPNMVSFPLAEGDVLVMMARTQKHWEHCLQKSKDAQQPRINITFRRVVK